MDYYEMKSEQPRLLKNCNKLRDCENVIAPHMRKIWMISEIPINNGDFNLLQQLVRGLSHFSMTDKEKVEHVWNHYPCSMAIYTVFVGIECYRSGDFWSGFFRQSGFDPSVQQAWGRHFLDFLRSHGLERYDEIEGHKYLIPILAHGGIPDYCLPDFFRNILYRSIEVGGASVREILDDLLNNSSVFSLTDKPVIRFLTHGGQAAITFFERCMQMAQTFQYGYTENFTDLNSEIGLPIRIVEKYSDWLENSKVETKQTDRISSPIFHYNQDKDTPSFIFPEQSFVHLTPDRVEYEIEPSQGKVITIHPNLLRLSSKYLVLEEEVFILPAESYKISLKVNNRYLRFWTFQGISKEKPILFFDVNTTNQDRLRQVKDGETLVLLHKDWSFSKREPVQVITEYRQPYSEWYDYRFYHISTQSKLIYLENTLGKSLPIDLQQNSNVSKLSPPTKVLSKNSNELIYINEIPILYFSTNQKIDGLIGSINLVDKSSNHRRSITMREVKDALVSSQDGWQLDLKRTQLFKGGEFGRYELVLHFINKRDEKYSLCLLPEIEVGIDKGMWPTPLEGFETQNINLGVPVAYNIQVIGEPSTLRFVERKSDKNVYRFTLEHSYDALTFAIEKEKKVVSLTINTRHITWNWTVDGTSGTNGLYKINTVDWDISNNIALKLKRQLAYSLMEEAGNNTLLVKILLQLLTKDEPLQLIAEKTLKNEQSIALSLDRIRDTVFHTNGFQFDIVVCISDGTKQEVSRFVCGTIEKGWNATNLRVLEEKNKFRRDYKRFKVLWEENIQADNRVLRIWDRERRKSEPWEIKLDTNEHESMYVEVPSDWMTPGDYRFELTQPEEDDIFGFDEPIFPVDLSAAVVDVKIQDVQQIAQNPEDLIKESYHIVKKRIEKERYSEWDVVQHQSGKQGTYYQFKTKSDQDYESVWHDFYHHVELVKTLESAGTLTLLDFGDYGCNASGEAVFYVIVQTYPPGNTLSSLLNSKKSFEEKFRVWLDVISSLSKLHGQNLCHGQLIPDDIYIVQTKLRQLILFPTFSWWYFNQIFSLEDRVIDVNYLPSNLNFRVYRQPEDDHFSLAQILFGIVCPERSLPIHLDQLFAYQGDWHEELYNVLFTLLSPSQESVLNSVYDMGQRLVNHLSRQLILSVAWDENDQQFDKSIKSKKEWEKNYLKDTEKDTYLFTTFDKEVRKEVLHVVGQLYEWKLFILKQPNQVGYDLSLVSYKEIPPQKRERSKEHGKLFHGIWTFTKRSGDKGRKFLENLKTEIKVETQEFLKRRQMQGTFLRWEEALRYQVAVMDSDEYRYAYKNLKVINHGSIIAVELLQKSGVEIGLTSGDEIIFSNGREELLAGRFSMQEGIYVYFETVKDINYTLLPSFGDFFKNNAQKRILVNRQQQALQKFKFGEGVHSILREGLLIPEEARAFPVDFNAFQALNEDQSKALKLALGTEAYFLLQGPPGTGKTTWITELILQIYRQNPKARILLASQSNVAIDHAFVKSATLFEKYSDHFRIVPSSIRLGNDKIGEGVQEWTVEQQVSKWADKIEQTADENIWSILNESMNDINRYNRLMKIFEDWKRVLKQSEDVIPFFLQQAPLLVGATCMGSYPFLKWNQKFDWVIIDEAGRATHPEILIPSLLGRKVIYVGDHKQLPPVVEDQLLGLGTKTFKRRDLEISLFEELFKNSNEEVRSTLKVQYRMDTAISQLVSNLFYSETPLLQGKKVLTETKFPSPWKTLNWITIDNHRDCMEQKESTSYFNRSEVEVIQKVLLQLNEWCRNQVIRKSVAIITGYTLQRNKLRDAIQILNLTHLEVEIDTVDAFQGRECDFVIYSVVRNNRSQNVGFLRDERRINVMLSRAREMIMVVGSSHMVRNLAKENVLHRIYTSISQSSYGLVRCWEEVDTWIY